MEKKYFAFFWKTGDVEKSEGYDVAHAFSSLGYGGGAMAALDMWLGPCATQEQLNIKVAEWQWDKEQRKWLDVIAMMA